MASRSSTPRSSEPRPHPAAAEDLALPIRYLDDDLVVVSKPAGMATHPGPGWWRGSCVNALLHAVSPWPGVGGVAGPGIVHRLDRDTSGLLVFARTDSAHRALLAAMEQRRIQRSYLAWVEGVLEGGGTVDLPLGRDPAQPQNVVVRADGKRAVTHYRVLRTHPDRTLIRATLETGRTHQIRVHLAHLGHPVLGDARYGTAGPGMLLHAWTLSFAHPQDGHWLSFRDPPPEAWRQAGLAGDDRELEGLDGPGEAQ